MSYSNQSNSGYYKNTGKDDRWPSTGRDSGYAEYATESSNVQPDPNTDPWPEEDNADQKQTGYNTAAHQQNYAITSANGHARVYNQSSPYAQESHNVSQQNSTPHGYTQRNAGGLYTPRGYAQAGSVSSGTQNTTRQQETVTRNWIWSEPHQKYYYNTTDPSGRPKVVFADEERS